MLYWLIPDVRMLFLKFQILVSALGYQNSKKFQTLVLLKRKRRMIESLFHLKFQTILSYAIVASTYYFKDENVIEKGEP
jgi:hypothetical protein